MHSEPTIPKGVIYSDRWPVYTWKNELLCQSERVVQHYREFLDKDTEVEHSPFHMLERALILSGFVMRRMDEKRLITDELSKKKFRIVTFNLKEDLDKFSAPWISDTGPHRASLYDFSVPERVEMTVRKLGDEIIHASQLSIIHDYDQVEDGLLISSDYNVNKRLLHLSPDQYTEIVKQVLDDLIYSQMDGYNEDTGEVIARRSRKRGSSPT